MKKRILSLILALSMVLSVLPLGAFAAPTLPKLVMKDGLPDLTGLTELQKGQYIGDNWGYDSNTGTLSLTYGTFDFSLANPQDTTNKTPADSAVACTIKIESGAEITGGIFNAIVHNGEWNIPGGTISNGIFNGEVTNNGTIGNGTFNGQVANEGTKATIKDGTFNRDVENRGTIDSKGTFNGEVTNYGTIKNGTFEIFVKNEGTDATIENGTFKGTVMNEGTIKDGTFNGEVQNNLDGKISDGAFSSTSTVYNYNSGTIEKGTFEGSVKNYGTILGGTFAAGLSKSDGKILGGVFNGVIEGTTGAGVYHITVDEASPDAKIEKVNDVPAVWDPYVVIESGKTKEVTVTANTDIYSLNGKSLSTNPYSSSQDSSDKTTVKFKMPKEGVTIGCGGLVMENGYPVGTSGNGWSYDGSTKTLTLKGTSREFDFSFTHPQNKTGTQPAPAVKCAIESGAKITGGTFEGSVKNH